MIPLILNIDQFDPEQFRQYNESFAFTPNGGRIDQYIQVGRKDANQRIAENNKCAKPGDDGIPKCAIWGPVVIDDLTVTQYFQLVPIGMEGRFPSTDGLSADDLPAKAMPPPLPTTVPFPLKVRNDAPVYSSKLYRVDYHKGDRHEGKLTEVTSDDITNDMKSGIEATYIRGEIVKPRLKVEI